MALNYNFNNWKGFTNLINASEKLNMKNMLGCSAAHGNRISFPTWISNTFLSINSGLERRTEKHIFKYFIHSFGLVHFVTSHILCCYIYQILSNIINSTMIQGAKPKKYSCSKYILFGVF